MQYSTIVHLVKFPGLYLLNFWFRCAAPPVLLFTFFCCIQLDRQRCFFLLITRILLFFYLLWGICPLPPRRDIYFIYTASALLTSLGLPHFKLLLFLSIFRPISIILHTSTLVFKNTCKICSLHWYLWKDNIYTTWTYHTNIRRMLFKRHPCSHPCITVEHS